jgi:hypothetical protein
MVLACFGVCMKSITRFVSGVRLNVQAEKKKKSCSSGRCSFVCSFLGKAALEARCDQFFDLPVPLVMDLVVAPLRL